MKKIEESKAQYYIKGLRFSIKEEIGYDIDDSTNQVIEVKTYKNNAKSLVQQLMQPDPLLELNPLADNLQSWFNGIMGQSTSRYNPGQPFYYSPVGYVYKISDPKNILANFRADGNVGTQCLLSFCEDSKSSTTIQIIWKEIIKNEKISQKLVSDPDFNTGLKNVDIMDEKMGSSLLDNLLKKFSQEEIGDELRDCIRNTAHDILKKYYKVTGHKARYTQNGLIAGEEFEYAESLYKNLMTDSKGFVTEVTIGKKPHSTKPNEEVDDSGRYTECVIHGTLNAIECVFTSINTRLIKLPELMDPSWAIEQHEDPAKVAAALKARIKSMQEIYHEFKIVKPDLAVAILDDKGILYTTRSQEHLIRLLEICDSKEESWQETLVQFVYENFQAIDIPPAQAATSIEPVIRNEEEEDDKRLFNPLSTPSAPISVKITGSVEEAEEDIFSVPDNVSGVAYSSVQPQSMMGTSQLMNKVGLHAELKPVSPIKEKSSQSFVVSGTFS